MKEVETALGKRITELERNTAQSHSEHLRVKADLDSLRDTHKAEKETLQNQLRNLDFNANQAVNLGGAQAEDMLKQKAQLQECEREL